jgi:hypothetical protein
MRTIARALVMAATLRRRQQQARHYGDLRAAWILAREEREIMRAAWPEKGPDNGHRSSTP